LGCCCWWWWWCICNLDELIVGTVLSNLFPDAQFFVGM
jgi:hypothetical protein